MGESNVLVSDALSSVQVPVAPPDPVVDATANPVEALPAILDVLEPPSDPPAAVHVLGVCHRCSRPIFELDQPCGRVGGMAPCNDPTLVTPTIAAAHKAHARAEARRTMLAVADEYTTLCAALSNVAGEHPAVRVLLEELVSACDSFVKADLAAKG